MGLRLSLIIPAYNESTRIGETLRLCNDYFASQDYATEIIVVDDGSNDGTGDMVRREFPEVRVVDYGHNRGKGYAVKQGMAAAKGQYRLFYDADGSTPVSEIDKIWTLFEGGADVVIGSRSMPESKIEVRQKPLREFMGRTFNSFMRILLGLDIIDTQCGFKAFTADSARDIFERQTLEGFCFDVELLYIARTRALTVKELPVTWINSPSSKVALVGDSAAMFADLFRIRLNGLRGTYDRGGEPAA